MQWNVCWLQTISVWNIALSFECVFQPGAVLKSNDIFPSIPDSSYHIFLTAKPRGHHGLRWVDKCAIKARQQLNCSAQRDETCPPRYDGKRFYGRAGGRLAGPTYCRLGYYLTQFYVIVNWIRHTTAACCEGGSKSHAVRAAVQPY